MTWLNLLWMVAVVASCSWIAANLLVVACTPLLKPPFGVGARRHLWFLAAVPWIFPLLAAASLMLLALAKSQDWIHHHCETHQAHHPHFCLEHLPQMALHFTSSLVGIATLFAVLAVIFWRIVQHTRVFAQSRLLRRLVQGQSVKNTLHETHPLAFILGIRKPLIFVSHGLHKLLSKRQMRMVLKHEIAHIRNKDVLKNTLFEILLAIHIYPKLLRARWHLTSEIRADAYVSQQFDSLEVADMLVKLRRIGMNSPFSASIAGGVFEERIAHLLNHNQGRRGTFPAIWLLYLVVVTFPFVLVSSHHSLETFWGWLL